MRLPQFITTRLYKKALSTMVSRKPDFVIQPDGHTVYLNRWWEIPRNKIFNIYLHQFLRSDDDRALHDHPWIFNISILLHGSYIEERILAGGVHTRKVYKAGDIIFRGPWAAHRVEVLNENETGVGDTAITMFLTGPVIRTWGFHCPKAWRSWKIFTNNEDYGKIGRGCD